MKNPEQTTWGQRDLPEDPAVAYRRLADQIDFFDRRSKQNQTTYKRLKTLTLVFAAFVTASAAVPLPTWVVPSLGAGIVVIEGLVQLNSLLHNWLSFRNTCELLKHEKYLCLSRAGAYRDSESPEQLLAERTEEILARARTEWIAVQQEHHKKHKPATTNDA